MRNNTIKKSISQILLAIFLISATGCSETLKQSSSSNEGSALSETGVVIEGTVALSSDQIQGASAGHILFAAQTGKEGEVELFLLKDGEKEESTGKKADVVGGAYKFEGVDPKETYLVGYKHKESDEVSAKSLVIIDEKSTDKKVSIKTDVESNYITQYFLDEVKDQGLSEAIDKDTLKAFVSVVKKVVKQLLTEEKLEEKVSTSADFFDGSFSKIDEDEQVKAVSEEVAVARLESEISKKEMDTKSTTTEVDGKRIEKRESIDGTIVEEKIFDLGGKLIESKLIKTTDDGKEYVQTNYFNSDDARLKSRKIVTPSKAEIEYNYAEITAPEIQDPVLMKKQIKLEEGYELISKYSDGKILSQNGDLYDQNLGVSFQIESSWIVTEKDYEKGIRYRLDKPNGEFSFSMKYPLPDFLLSEEQYLAKVLESYPNAESSAVDTITISGKEFIRVSVVTSGRRFYHYFHFLQSVYDEIQRRALYEFIYDTSLENDDIARETILSTFQVRQSVGVPQGMAIGVPLSQHVSVEDEYDLSTIFNQFMDLSGDKTHYSQAIDISLKEDDDSYAIVNVEGTKLSFKKEGRATVLIRSAVNPALSETKMEFNVKSPDYDELFSNGINESWAHGDADIKNELMTLLGVFKPVSSFSTEEEEVIKRYKSYFFYKLTLETRKEARGILSRLQETAKKAIEEAAKDDTEEAAKDVTEEAAKDDTEEAVKDVAEDTAEDVAVVDDGVKINKVNVIKQNRDIDFNDADINGEVVFAETKGDEKGIYYYSAKPVLVQAEPGFVIVVKNIDKNKEYSTGENHIKNLDVWLFENAPSPGRGWANIFYRHGGSLQDTDGDGIDDNVVDADSWDHWSQRFAVYQIPAVGDAGEKTKHTFTDADGNVFVYEYNDAGKKIKGIVTYVDGYASTLSYEYNDAGQIIKRISSDTDENVFVYEYNDAGQKIKETVTDSDGKVSVYEYNDAGQKIKTTIKERSGVVRVVELNDTGQKIKETLTYSNGTVVGYEYNDAGKQTKKTQRYSDGRVYLYEYNDAGQVSKSSIDGKVSVYEYSDAGKKIKETVTGSDGKVSVYEYNDAGEVIKETTSP